MRISDWSSDVCSSDLLAQSGQVPCRANGICLGPASAAQAQALDQGIVTGLVLALHVVQQAPALADHDQKAAARVEILAMSLEMLGKIRDGLRQDGDLNFRRSGVTLVGAILFTQPSL